MTNSTVIPKKLGANVINSSQTQFVLWAPNAKKAEIVLTNPKKENYEMTPGPQGYYELTIPKNLSGSQYLIRLDGKTDRPDPASQFQPTGVHTASEVVSHDFPWTDKSWNGLNLSEYIFYELHIGTFTPEGTFESAISKLDYLVDLGITAIEIMPVAQFPGKRNWGYDGVYPFAPQNSYGGPEGLKKLVNACHEKGLAVVMDVVYNHLGPEGNYLRDFGPYFTNKYKTPWGAALNFDDSDSDHVRRFFIENALMWVEDYHIDALRLDAVHAIYDFSAKTFLSDLADAVQEKAGQLNRKAYLIAESSLNDVRLINPREKGGFALDGQWNDDFHHTLHYHLTGENKGYYADFTDPTHLSTAMNETFVYSGQYSPFRRCRHGNSAKNNPPQQFVVFSQNHDQVGNRMLGERLSLLTTPEGLKLAAGLTILSPYLPLLFMGEEFGETAPFLYFIDHGDKGLIDAVRKGRKNEFKQFKWKGNPPDPQSEETFNRSKLAWNDMSANGQKTIYSFYKKLISIRRNEKLISECQRDWISSEYNEKDLLTVRIQKSNDQLLMLFNLSSTITNDYKLISKSTSEILLDSSAPEETYSQEKITNIKYNNSSITIKPQSFLVIKQQG